MFGTRVNRPGDRIRDRGLSRSNANIGDVASAIGSDSDLPHKNGRAFSEQGAQRYLY